MRVALALLAAVGSALIGRSVARGCARRAAALRSAMDAMQLLRIQMLERLLPLRAALEKSAFEPFRAVASELLNGDGAPGAWERARAALTRRGRALDCMMPEDLAALDRLFAGLGATARAEQELLFSACLAEIGLLEGEARRTGAEKGRLYTTLGLLGGLMLAIAFV